MVDGIVDENRGSHLTRRHELQGEQQEVLHAALDDEGEGLALDQLDEGVAEHRAVEVVLQGIDVRAVLVHGRAA